uniref:Zinc finger, CCHC-type n=1 Tax=Tanacetum cinerariifolium TaxID=118510 RepID=A0A6L2MW95_TANCI|nr:hypothetical protein [Tanacetum cinerariifolium]
MSASNQQTLADLGANERPPMLEKGNYIPRESRFRKFLDNKLEEGERMWHLIEKGPYVSPMIPDPDDTKQQIIKLLSKMTEINKKRYIGDLRVMIYLLQAIPNDIYNLVDACKTAQEMWEHIKRETMLLAMKDEAKSNLKDEENNFMLDNSFGDETLEELTAAVIMMAHIQPADDNAVTEPNYDAKDVSEVNASHKVHGQVNHVKRKTIIHTSNDYQIVSNIIFDDPYVKNNGGTSKHDSNAHGQYHDIHNLAYNV